jgi:hypothetical protein
MTMMAAMAQIETIIFFIVLVLFVSFLYHLHSCVRAGPVLIRRCIRPSEPVLFFRSRTKRLRFEPVPAPDLRRVSGRIPLQIRAHQLQ